MKTLPITPARRRPSKTVVCMRSNPDMVFAVLAAIALMLWAAKVLFS